MGITAVTKNGKACWQVQVIRHGKRLRRFLDRKHFRHQDALELERRLLDDLATAPRECTAPAPPPALAQPAPLTFAAFADRYLALQDPARSDHPNKLRNVHRHLLPVLGHLPLRAITRPVIDDLRLRLRAAPVRPGADRPRRPKTINNILATLRAILLLAYDYDLLDRVPRIPLDREDRIEPAFLDFAETDAFLAAADPAWRPLLTLAVRTGLRRGELLELRWRDLDLDAPQPHLRVTRALRYLPGGRVLVKEPKGRRPRAVPIPPDAADTLRAHRGPHRPPPDALLFPGPDGAHLPYRPFFNAVTQAARAAGIHRHVHPHLLRHTFASHCYIRGIPPQIVQAWLGHASVVTTERYAHLLPEPNPATSSMLEPAQVSAKRLESKIDTSLDKSSIRPSLSDAGL